MRETGKRSFLTRARQAAGENRTVSLLCALMILAIAALLIFPVSAGGDRTAVSRYSSVENIAELATLKGYYHNVAVYEGTPEGIEKAVGVIMTWPFNEWIRPGYKRFWLEYSGTVEYGVDADQIVIGAPDFRGVIDVYVPGARAINVDADEDSMSVPVRDTGLFVNITADDLGRAFAEAQSRMREEAGRDEGLLKRARENVKTLLEKYITNLGAGLGVRYTVNWVDTPPRK